MKAKNIFKKSFCMVLATMLSSTFVLTACNPDSGEGSGGGNNNTIQATDTYLVKNGISPYKIVIPEMRSEMIDLSAKDLQYFFELATGAKLEIITDNNISDPKGKYLSIGETSIMKASGMKCDVQKLEYDGYKIQTYGDAVVMCGAKEDGSAIAPYEFLDKQFNLEIYTPDVYTYETTQNELLLDYDLTDIPDIPYRSGGGWLVFNGTKTDQLRYRMNGHGERWGIMGHTTFHVLPKETYWAEHPDWYNNQQDIGLATQLNWANTEMWDQFVENMKVLITNNPNQMYWQIGQQDIKVPGDGPGYTEVYEKYGEFHSAVFIQFFNHVVRELNKWTAVAFPDNVYKYFMFGYHTTELPPATYNSKTKEWEPVHEDVILEPNAGVMIAPISDSTSISYFDQEYNVSSYRVFEGWAACTKNLAVWGYSTNFLDYLSPYNNWDSYKENYVKYYERGCQFLYEQGGAYNAKGCPNFNELRQYLVSKLSWDTSLDCEQLIVDFMKAYYAEGWEYVYEYFTLMRTHMAKLFYEENIDYGRIYMQRPNVDPSHFPKPLLDKCEDLFDKALKMTKVAGNDRATFAIERDRLPLRVLLFDHYYLHYDTQTYLEMVYDFKRVMNESGCTVYSETQLLVSDLINSWIAQVG